MFQFRQRSPYLTSDQRLADVIAAIQAVGTYKYYKLTFADWSQRISGTSQKSAYWESVFKEHPEFFRLDSTKTRASLVLRRQRQNLYNVDDETEWTRQQFDTADDATKLRFSRKPLTADEIEALINVAVSLHSRAAERARDRRWLIAPTLAFIGALLGAILPKII